MLYLLSITEYCYTWQVLVSTQSVLNGYFMLLIGLHLDVACAWITHTLLLPSVPSPPPCSPLCVESGSPYPFILSRVPPQVILLHSNKSKSRSPISPNTPSHNTTPSASSTLSPCTPSLPWRTRRLPLVWTHVTRHGHTATLTTTPLLGVYFQSERYSILLPLSLSLLFLVIMGC